MPRQPRAYRSRKCTCGKSTILRGLHRRCAAARAPSSADLLPEAAVQASPEAEHLGRPQRVLRPALVYEVPPQGPVQRAGGPRIALEGHCKGRQPCVDGVHLRPQRPSVGGVAVLDQFPIAARNLAPCKRHRLTAGIGADIVRRQAEDPGMPPGGRWSGAYGGRLRRQRLWMFPHFVSVEVVRVGVVLAGDTIVAVHGSGG